MIYVTADGRLHSNVLDSVPFITIQRNTYQWSLIAVIQNIQHVPTEGDFLFKNFRFTSKKLLHSGPF